MIQKRAIQEGITEENGMLYFRTFEQFILTRKILNETIEKRDDAFVTATAHLSDSEIEQFEETTGYNEDQPLIDFETTYSFKSLRQKMSEEEDVYLNNWPSSIGTDPNHFIIDEVDQTLVNINAEVRIGMSIFVFRQEATIEIYDASYETLEKVRGTEDVRKLMNYAKVRVYLQKFNDDEEYLRNGVGVGNPPPPPPPPSGIDSNSCKNSVGDRGFYPSEGADNRYKWIVTLWSYPWDCGPQAKMKSYKKKRKKRRDMNITVNANMVTDKKSCVEGLHVSDGSEVKNKKKVKTKHPGSSCHANSGKVVGSYWAKGVGSTTQTLTW